MASQPPQPPNATGAGNPQKELAALRASTLRLKGRLDKSVKRQTELEALLLSSEDDIASLRKEKLARDSTISACDAAAANLETLLSAHPLLPQSSSSSALPLSDNESNNPNSSTVPSASVLPNLVTRCAMLFTSLAATREDFSRSLEDVTEKLNASQADLISKSDTITSLQLHVDSAREEAIRQTSRANELAAARVQLAELRDTEIDALRAEMAQKTRAVRMESTSAATEKDAMIADLNERLGESVRLVELHAEEQKKLVQAHEAAVAEEKALTEAAREEAKRLAEEHDAKLVSLNERLVEVSEAAKSSALQRCQREQELESALIEQKLLAEAACKEAEVSRVEKHNSIVALNERLAEVSKAKDVLEIQYQNVKQVHDAALEDQKSLLETARKEAERTINEKDVAIGAMNKRLAESQSAAEQLMEEGRLRMQEHEAALTEQRNLTEAARAEQNSVIEAARSEAESLLAEKDTAINSLNERLTEASKVAEALSKQLRERQKEYEVLVAEQKSIIEAAHKEAASALAEKDSNIAQLKKNLSHAVNTAHAAVEEQNQLRQEHEGALANKTALLAASEEQVASYKEELEVMRQRLEGVVRGLETSKLEEKNNFESSMNELRSKVAELSSQLFEEQSTCTNVRAEALDRENKLKASMEQRIAATLKMKEASENNLQRALQEQDFLRKQAKDEGTSFAYELAAVRNSMRDQKSAFEVAKSKREDEVMKMRALLEEEVSSLKNRLTETENQFTQQACEADERFRSTIAEQQALTTRAEFQASGAVSQLAEVRKTLDEQTESALCATADVRKRFECAMQEKDKSLQETLTEMKNVRREKDDELARKERDLAEHVSKLRLAESVVLRLQGDIETLTSAAQLTVSSLEQKISAVNVEKLAQKESFAKTKLDIANEISALKSAVQTRDCQLSDKSAKIDELQSHLSTLSQKVESKETEIKFISDQHTTFAEEADAGQKELSIKLCEAEERIVQLENDVQVAADDFAEEVKLIKEESSRQRDELSEKLLVTETELEDRTTLLEMKCLEMEEATTTLEEKLSAKEEECILQISQLEAIGREKDQVEQEKSALSEKLVKKLDVMKKCKENLGLSQAVNAHATVDAMELEDRLISLSDYVDELELMNKSLLNHVREIKDANTVLEGDKSRMEAEKADAIKALNELQADRDSLDQEIVRLREYAEGCVRQTEERAATELAELRTQFESLSHDANEAKEKVAEESKIQTLLVKQVDVLKKTIETTDGDLSLAKRTNKELTDRFEVVEKKNERLSATVKNYQAMLTQAREVAENMSAKLSTKITEVRTLQSSLEDTKSGMEAVQSQLDEVNNCITSVFKNPRISTACASDPEDVDNTEDKTPLDMLSAISNRVHEAEDLKLQLSATKKDLASAVTSVHEMKENISAKSERIVRLEQKLHDAKTTADALRQSQDEEIKVLSDKLNVASSSVESLTQKLDGAAACYEKNLSSTLESLQLVTEEKENLAERLLAAESCLSDVQADVDNLLTTSQRTSELSCTAEERANSSQSTIEKLSKCIADLNTQKVTALSTLNSTEVALKKANDEMSTISEEKLEIESTLSEKEKMLDESRAEAQRLECILAELRSGTEAASKDMETKISAVHKSLTEKHNEKILLLRKDLEAKIQEARQSSEEVQSRLKSELQEAQETVVSLQDKLDIAVDEKKTTLTESSKEIESLRKKVTTLSDAHKATLRTVKSVEDMNTEKDEVIKVLEEKQSILSNEVSNLKRNETQVSHKLERASAAIETLEAKKKELEDNIVSKQNEFDEAVSRMSEQLQSSKNDLSSAAKERDALRRSVERYEDEVKRLEEKVVSELREELQEAKKSLEQATQHIDEKENATTKLEEEHRRELSEASQKMANLENRITSLKRDAEDQHDKYEEALEQLRRDRSGAISDAQTLEVQLSDAIGERSKLMDDLKMRCDALSEAERKTTAALREAADASDRMKELTASLQAQTTQSAADMEKVRDGAEIRVKEVREELGKRLEESMALTTKLQTEADKSAKALVKADKHIALLEKKAAVSAEESSAALSALERNVDERNIQVEEAKKECLDLRRQLEEKNRTGAACTATKDGEQGENVAELRLKLNEASRQSAQIEKAAKEYGRRMKERQKLNQKYKASVRKNALLKAELSRLKSGQIAAVNKANEDADNTTAGVKAIAHDESVVGQGKILGVKRSFDAKSPAKGGRRVRRMPILPVSENDMQR